MGDFLHPSSAVGIPMAGPRDPTLPTPSLSERDASFTTVDLVHADSGAVDLVNVDLASPSSSLTTPRGGGAFSGYAAGSSILPTGTGAPGGVPAIGVPLQATAVNAESLLAQAQGVDAVVLELQEALMRVSSAVEEARSVSDRIELEVSLLYREGNSQVEEARGVSDRLELEVSVLLTWSPHRGHGAEEQSYGVRPSVWKAQVVPRLI